MASSPRYLPAAPGFTYLSAKPYRWLLRSRKLSSSCILSRQAGTTLPGPGHHRQPKTHRRRKKTRQKPQQPIFLECTAFHAAGSDLPGPCMPPPPAPDIRSLAPPGPAPPLPAACAAQPARSTIIADKVTRRVRCIPPNCECTHLVTCAGVISGPSDRVCLPTLSPPRPLPNTFTQKRRGWLGHQTACGGAPGVI